MSASVGAYYDFQSLATLRTEAVQSPSGAVDEVAAQFESLFVQMMLKSMRDATISGGLFDSHQLDTYQGMFDQQVSLHLSRQGALGLADILVQQLEGQSGASRPGDSETAERIASLIPADGRPVTGEHSVPAPLSSTPADRPVLDSRAGGNWQPATPEEFIRDVWEHAVSAAAKLGVEPRVLVAQSALETGWGKKVIQTRNGGSSLNLFGIKAGADWGGDSASVRTLEFQDGVAAMQKASFRVYDSIGGSFEDYVDFLTSNPRYEAALSNASDSDEFLRGLQNAGYATDPAYADKILDILGRDDYEPVFRELKNREFSSLPSREGNAS